jgi:hypothetical protein
MSSAEAAQELTKLGATVALPAWFAYVNTPEDEAELMDFRDEADWVRYESGLPPIRVVDLRLPATAAHNGRH